MTPAPSTFRGRLLPATAATALFALFAGGAWYGFEAISSQPLRRVTFAGDAQKLAGKDADFHRRGV